MTSVRAALLYLIYIILLGALVTAIVLALHPKHHTSTKTSHVVTSQSAKQKSSMPSSSTRPRSSQPTTPPSNSAPSASAPSSSAGSQTGQAGSTATHQLTNTGPGDIVAVFAVASLAGGLAHYRWAKRY